MSLLTYLMTSFRACVAAYNCVVWVYSTGKETIFLRRFLRLVYTTTFCVCTQIGRNLRHNHHTNARFVNGHFVRYGNLGLFKVAGVAWLRLCHTDSRSRQPAIT